MSKGQKQYKSKLSGHTDAIVNIYIVYGETGSTLASISCDGNLRVWDCLNKRVDEKKYLRRFPEDQDEDGNLIVKKLYASEYIDKACFNAKTVFCTYPDGSIYAWNMKEGELLYTFKGHDEKITDIIMVNDSTFATCSYDCTVVIWDSLKGVSTHVFKFKDTVKQMILIKNFLYQLVGQNEVSIIDQNKSTIIYGVIFEDHTITAICATEKLFQFADNSAHLYSIKTEEFQPLGIHATAQFRAEFVDKQPKKLAHIAHRSRIIKIVHYKDYIFTLSDDKTVKVWSYPDMELLDELIGHLNGVNAMDIAAGHIYTGSFDHTIRSWSYTEMVERIEERKKFAHEQFYSMKAEKYKGYLANKKKKKKGRRGMKKK